MMYFGLEDMLNNTILGTPIEELLPIAEEITRELKLESKENLYIVAIEECAEIQQCITKILRFGEKTSNPENKKMDNNETELLKEYYQLQTIMDMLIENGHIKNLSSEEIEKIKTIKKSKVLYYSQVSKKLGLINK